MRISVHDLYRRKTDHLEGDAHEVEAELAQRWPGQCAEVDPDEGPEALVEHLNQSLQGFSFDLEPDGLEKMQPAPSFPKIGVEDRRETDMVTTERQLGIKHGLMFNHTQAGLGRARENYHPDAWSIGKRKVAEAHESHRGASHVASFFHDGRQDVRSVSYARAGAMAPSRHENGPLATQQHENLHAMFDRVAVKYGEQGRLMLASRLWDELPKQYQRAVDTVQSRLTGDVYKGKPHEIEEKLARLLNFVNDPHEREKFHEVSGHADDDIDMRMIYGSSLKRALQIVRGAARRADESWLQPRLYQPSNRSVKKSEGEQNEVEIPGGYRLQHHSDPGQNEWGVTAYDQDKNPVGEAQFAGTFRAPRDDEDPNHLVLDGLKGWNVDVHPDHRRRGLATAMYHRAAEVFGMPVRAGDFQTPSGRAFLDHLKKVSLQKSLSDAKQAEFDAETARIVESRSTPEGRRPHKFRAAKWTHSNGHPRCRLCGTEEMVGGECPGADADGKGERGHLPVAKREQPPPDPHQWDFSPGGPEEMVADDSEARQLFAAAAFLAGGQSPASDVIRSFLRSDSDPESCALSAFGISDTEENRASLRATAEAMGCACRLSKAEAAQQPDPNAMYADAAPLLPGSDSAAEEVRTSAADGAITLVQLGGKHSAGSAVARVKSGPSLLLKPGSGPQSPAAGARDDISSQSRREAVFYRLAEAMGLGEWVPRAELLRAGGREVAAIELLSPAEWRNVSKVMKRDPGRFAVELERYRSHGLLHRWAVLDGVAGNPDRHNQNIMVSKRGEWRLIDHGSAFAGEGFDPAHDGNSFVPFYLRPSAPGDFHQLPPEERFRHMVVAPPEVDQELAEWIAGLDAERIGWVVMDCGIVPGPVVERLKLVKSLPQSVSASINRVWCGMGWGWSPAAAG
jgi:GNAT superfamily N-acetyltransferase